MKLKKLVLAGFKSFADRTEFDFDDGVTCVVGPNGCGKSNIVDAIKWVLGEQSAKSLRGSEMLDVVFNGSAARKAANVAEVTLVFDNSDGMLQPALQEPGVSFDSVAITRRLYRDGQSEYLINKVPCRLKDIREMFLDTGVGRDAYSVIEQGRVEMFLQASHEDRRAIFDEAAGISKYKARKKESLRKLERVEQNLLRLNDILGEVDKSLRSIKYQAGKARNYQTYSQRLKELRSLHFLAQYHTLSHQRKGLQWELDAANDRLSSIHARIDQLEAAGSATEIEANDLERKSRELQGQVAALAGQITTCQERADMLIARVKELGDQITAAVVRCEGTEAKVETIGNDLLGKQEALRELENRAAELTGRCDAMRQEHHNGELAVTELQAELEDEKAGTIDLLRRTAQLHNEIHGLGIRRENLDGQKTRLADRARELDDSLAAALTRKAEAEAKLGDIQAVLTATQAKLDETKQANQRLSDDERTLQNQLSETREQRSAVVSRMEALQEMLQRLEGVGLGVRRVMEAVRDGRLPVIRGMLGDFVSTDVHHAAIIEAALAGADQHLVAMSLGEVRDAAGELAQALGDGASVEILCLDHLQVWKDDFTAADFPQVIARVMDWVRLDAALAPALWRILGRTLVVKDLADAVAALPAVPEGYRFVTLSGEVLEADGRVRLGSANRASGVIQRRSELADLAERKTHLEEQVAELDTRWQQNRTQQHHLEQLQQSLRTAIYEANTERVEAESRRTQLAEQIAKFQREQPLIAGDLDRLAAEIEASVKAEHEVRQKAAELERLNAERQQQVEKLTEQLGAARSRQTELASQLTELKVALAQADEKKLAVQQAAGELARQRDQMTEELTRARAEIELNRQRRADAEASIARTAEEIERLYAEHERVQQTAEEVEESRRGLHEKLEEIRAQLAERRKEQEQVSEGVSAKRVELSEADVRVESVISRASDEMSMNLLELFPSYQHDDQRDWNAVEAEIQDLRGKIERLGNVNLDAIAEQEQLEQRQQFLTTQLDDIKSSQAQLTELIRKINKESREMFVKTFEEIRNNFRQVFRKLFGGGRADIFLVNEEDVLESGIEVVAQPPGKELRSLSLLSGGEKTMTALSMLFSIFKSRPSPFCLLDEVDAALDEANNERFNNLIREFVPRSQMIMISHAKRTMSMANVLYGVTMQEPGVSRRISVRFEDVGKKLDEQLQPVGA